MIYLCPLTFRFCFIPCVSAVSVTTRGSRAAQTEAKGQRGEGLFSSKSLPSICALVSGPVNPLNCGVVCGLLSDAAAGAGADPAEGGQPHGAGSHRAQEETQDGLAGQRRRRRGSDTHSLMATEPLMSPAEPAPVGSLGLLNGG